MNIFYGKDDTLKLSQVLKIRNMVKENEREWSNDVSSYFHSTVLTYSHNNYDDMNNEIKNKNDGSLSHVPNIVLKFYIYYHI